MYKRLGYNLQLILYMSVHRMQSGMDDEVYFLCHVRTVLET